MAQHFLATTSPYTFVWHDNSGQAQAENSSQINCKVTIEGLTINVADDANLSEPIILINSAANGNKSRNIINLGKHSQVQVIEYLMSDDPNASNQVDTTINCGEHSQLKHCILQHASEDTTITQKNNTVINQATESRVTSNLFAFGGGSSVIFLNIALNGLSAKCNAASLAYTRGAENQNVVLQIDHNQPRCTSSSVARSILKDKSTTDFTGRIVVHPGAKRTNAELQIKNLLCSPKAQANNKPELEIYNDDVRCSHGSSTGQLDQAALFYMRSRGIDLETATRMLITGFIQPAIDSCTIPSINEYVQKIITER